MIGVVIVGGGPNGLMLACELALAGVRPVVLEQRPAGEITQNRANGLTGRVVPLLDRRGLYERLVGTSGPPAPVPGHVFGGFRLDQHDLPDRPIYALPVQQHRVEQVLADRAAELGVEVRRGQEVTGLSQDEKSVTIDIREQEPVEASFVVGADGSLSTVRAAVAIDFPAVARDTALWRWGRVSVPPDMIDANGGLIVPGFGIVAPILPLRTERGVVIWAPFPGQDPMLITMQWDQSSEGQEASLDKLRASAARVLGADVPLGPPLTAGPDTMRARSDWATRIAARYREGRVLLLGDAAHVHPPLGALGLSLGLQDTVNLGWKLAAELHGHAPVGLLDTYESERRPAADRVIMQVLAQTALISPGDQVTALRQLFGELLTLPGTRQHLADLVASSDVTYEMGTATGPLVGCWAPDLPGLRELTRTGRPLLLDPTGTLTAGPWAQQVDVVAGEGLDTALLLRPDCYVAWQGTTSDGLDDALARWFGKR
jgi:2-polyprenyl-6-methoxyphenol hydroxylase-like FAD-dependent oxidoreductase